MQWKSWFHVSSLVSTLCPTKDLELQLSLQRPKPKKLQQGLTIKEVNHLESAQYSYVTHKDPYSSAYTNRWRLVRGTFLF